jgi:hypothetical protein
VSDTSSSGAGWGGCRGLRSSVAAVLRQLSMKPAPPLSPKIYNNFNRSYKLDIISDLNDFNFMTAKPSDMGIGHAGGHKSPSADYLPNL